MNDFQLSKIYSQFYLFLTLQYFKVEINIKYPIRDTLLHPRFGIEGTPILY